MYLDVDSVLLDAGLKSENFPLLITFSFNLFLSARQNPSSQRFPRARIPPPNFTLFCAALWLL
jgi:hypothetical protein